MDNNKKIILKVLVGSRAHGLHNDESDYDYRAVYVLPTSDILSLGFKYKGNDWIEGKEDNTSYEIGHFLKLATQCNPTILEIFKAPVVSATRDGRELRELFNYVWSPKRAYDAFTGYGFNQRKKFLDKKDNRQDKFAVAYIRTLYNLLDLLKTGTFNLEIKDDVLKQVLLKYKSGKYTMGEIIQHAEDILGYINIVFPQCKHEQNMDKINDFLLTIRKDKHYWAMDK